ncbi:unnamed protein product [Polarella glacialis]|uniref:DNA (cytosine-5-)-methyltransferase n=1 Tax=Polarella glacialis TaxID=89957 RepID=A0A813L3Y2_POLGL|nr:unnamed protein product [Polarella glacialis]
MAIALTCARLYTWLNCNPIYTLKCAYYFKDADGADMNERRKDHPLACGELDDQVRFYEVGKEYLFLHPSKMMKAMGPGLQNIWEVETWLEKVRVRKVQQQIATLQRSLGSPQDREGSGAASSAGAERAVPPEGEDKAFRTVGEVADQLRQALNSGLRPAPLGFAAKAAAPPHKAGTVRVHFEVDADRLLGATPKSAALSKASAGTWSPSLRHPPARSATASASSRAPAASRVSTSPSRSCSSTYQEATPTPSRSPGEGCRPKVKKKNKGRKKKESQRQWREARASRRQCLEAGRTVSSPDWAPGDLRRGDRLLVRVQSELGSIKAVGRIAEIGLQREGIFALLKLEGVQDPSFRKAMVQESIASREDLGKRWLHLCDAVSCPLATGDSVHLHLESVRLLHEQEVPWGENLLAVSPAEFRAWEEQSATEDLPLRHDAASQEAAPHPEAWPEEDEGAEMKSLHALAREFGFEPGPGQKLKKSKPTFPPVPPPAKLPEEDDEVRSQEDVGKKKKASARQGLRPAQEASSSSRGAPNMCIGEFLSKKMLEHSGSAEKPQTQLLPDVGPDIKAKKKRGKRRRRSRRKGRGSESTSESGSTSSEGEGNFSREENRIRQLALAKPGFLTLTTLRGLGEALVRETGEGQGSGLNPLFLKYVSLVLLRQHSLAPGPRQEVRTLATALDLLVVGRVAAALDVLSQRFKAIELAQVHGSYKVASHLELVARDEPALSSRLETKEAVRELKRDEPRATALAAATSAEPGSLRSEAPLGFPRQGEGPVTEIPCLAGHSLAEVGIKLFGLVQSGRNLPSELQQALSDLWRPSTGSLFSTTREASSTALGEAPASLLPIPVGVPEIESSTDRTKVTACRVFGWHDSKLLSGLFGIQKGEQTSSGIEILRFIMNLIPFNGICSDNIKGDIATLPMFSQWTPLELLPHVLASRVLGMGFIGSGDIATLPMFSQWTPLELLVEDVFLLSSEDLKCIFYLFGLDDVWLKFQAFSRVLPEALWPVGATEPHVLASRVLGMGFIGSVGIAQHLRRNMLLANKPQGAGLNACTELRKDRAFPSGTAGFWKVYLGNWDELRVTSRASARLLEGKPSPENLDIHASYLFNEAPRHPKKALHHAIKGLTQGALLDGEEGSARPKPEKVAKYIAVIVHILRQGFVNLRQLQLLMGVFLVPLARMDFRRPYCHVVTASDASESGGGVTASRGLTPWGVKAALSPTNLTIDFQTDCSILGVGCFDGISALQVALEILGAPIAGFVSIENKMEAIRVIRANYPSTQHFSDIKSFGEAQVRQLALSFPRVQLVLVGAGPPCQGVSALNAGRLGAVEDPRSSLQSRVAWLRDLFILGFPWAKVQVLEESVASMAADGVSVLEERGAGWQAFTPIELCIPFGDQRDFLSPGWQKVEVNRPFPTFTTSIPKENPGPQPAGLQSCDTDAIKRWEMDRFRFPPYTYNRAHLIINKAGVLRQPNVEEREIMLGFPRGYTQACLPKGVRSSRPRLWEDTRLSLLGNSWSAPVVSWLLKNLLVAERLIPEISLQTRVARFDPRELRGSLHQVLDRPPLGSLPPNLPGSNEAIELALVRNISKSSSSKGSDVKMTSGGNEGPDVWPRKAIPSKLWRWRTICSWRFKHLHGPEHINVLELRAFLTSLRWRLRKKGGIAKRFFHLLDSQVNLGILAKGRTSSRKFLQCSVRLSLSVGARTRKRYDVALRGEKKKDRCERPLTPLPPSRTPGLGSNASFQQHGVLLKLGASMSCLQEPHLSPKTWLNLWLERGWPGVDQISALPASWLSECSFALVSLMFLLVIFQWTPAANPVF